MNSASHYRGRLAPSPTGYLHLGHARTFWRAQERARARGGTLILRNEDLDAARFKMEFVEAMLEDLRWFGFAWSEGPDVGGAHAPYNQSERMEIYRGALDQLRAGNFIYPCACSRKDIQAAVTAPHLGEEGLIYPGTCRPKEGDKWQVTGDTNPCHPLNHARVSASPQLALSGSRWGDHFLSRMEILARRALLPAGILGILWCGVATACRRINSPVWRMTPPCASPKSCAARTCCLAQPGSFYSIARWV